MLKLAPKTTVPPQRGSAANQERRRLLFALALLLVALGIVLAKNRDFWFGSEQMESASADSEDSENSLASSTTSKPYHKVSADRTNTKARVDLPVSRLSTAPKAATPADAPVIATDRTVLPPLEVEVVAGDSHRMIRPGSNASKVEITDLTKGPAINAAERENLSTARGPEIRENLDVTYPLLSQKSKVQGSVVLRAVVDADGAIANLRVISGPAILSTAAQQAVRQWRFKPVLQNGQAVETQATITVNFSIRVSGDTANAI